MNRNPVEAVLGFAVLIFVAVFVMSSASHLSVKTVDGYPLMVSFERFLSSVNCSKYIISLPG